MIKTLIFILLPLAAMAQRYTLTDTTYTVQDSLFYEVREVAYSTGESSVTKTLIGDSVRVFNAAFQKFQDESARLANLAQQVFNAGKTLNSLKKESDYVLGITGKDPLDTITSRFSSDFLASGWTLRDTSVLDVDFSVNANGQFRYEITGQGTKNAFLYGSAISLNNYFGTGKDLHIFKTESGNYRNRDGTILLRKPGGSLSRDAVAPDFEAETILLKPVFKAKKQAKKKKN